MLTTRRTWPALLGLVCLLCESAGAAPTAQVPAGRSEGAVEVGTRIAFVIDAPVGAISAAERADIVNRRIETILNDPAYDPALIRAGSLPDGSAAVVLGDLALIGVTAADAGADEVTPTELAERWARVLREEIGQIKPLYAKRGQVDIKTLSEHRVLLLLLQVALLLLAARAGGEIMARLGQSPVIGQLLAGVALGPSVLGWLLPQSRAVLFPVEATQSYLLEVISWLGVLFLLLLAGLESDLAMMRAQGRAALGTALLGAAVPMALGIGFGLVMPEHLLLSGDQRVLLAVFLGTALAVSSVPVIATILMDMGKLRGTVGQVTLAAALAHDTIGWIVLAVVAALAAGGAFEISLVTRTVLGTLVYAGLGLTLGRRWVAALLDWVARRSRVDQGLLATVVVLMLASAAVTQFIGVHAVLGAFIMGMVLRGQADISERVVHPIEALTMGLFAPIFFAAAGLNVSLAVLADPVLLGWTLVFTALACLGKVAGCYVGGRLAGMERWSALSVGLGTNARGAMGLIVGTLGFSLGLLTVDLFSILIIMALLTTAMTPPLLRWSLAGAPGPEQPDTAASFTAPALAGSLRLAVAAWDGPGAALGAKVAALLASGRDLPCVELTRGELGLGQPTAAWSEQITEQMASGDLIVLGAGGERGSSLSALAQAALRAGHPVLLAQAARHDEPWPPRRILLPTKGVGHGTLAAEVAATLARECEARLLGLHVLPLVQDSLFWLPETDLAEAHARQLAAVAEGIATAHGVDIDLAWCQAPHAGGAIVASAVEREADLIVIGGTPRPSDLLALGATVAYVLLHAPCPVIVAVPPARHADSHQFHRSPQVS